MWRVMQMWSQFTHFNTYWEEFWIANLVKFYNVFLRVSEGFMKVNEGLYDQVKKM